MRKPIHHISRLVLLFVSAVVFVAQTNHSTPFTGTWKMNLAKSKFSPGPPPQSQTVTIAPDGTFTVERVDAQGKSYKTSHPWSGGAEVPVEGVENETMISKIQGHTADDTWKIRGKTIQTVHAVVSPDGRTITATIQATDNQGRPVHNVVILDKQ
jgi:hypothetical protein